MSVTYSENDLRTEGKDGDESFASFFTSIQTRFKYVNFRLALVIFFLGANTAFLVHEQLTYYLQLRYSLAQGLAYSLLCELAVVLLSLAASWTHAWWIRRALNLSVLATVVLIGSMIESGVRAKEASAISQSYSMKNMQVIERSLAAQVEALDASKFAKRREALIDKAILLHRELASDAFAASSVDYTPLIWLRYLALVWNLLLSTVLSRLYRVR